MATDREGPPWDDLAVLGRAIGGRRIVLLGENGHGVAEFTTAKVRLVRYLVDVLAFDVIAFETSFHDCAAADLALAQQPAVRSAAQCLNYQMEQAQILPLFDLLRAAREAGRAVTLAGLDIQLQGGETRSRPAFLRDALAGYAPDLARRVAATDSAVIEQSLLPADSLAAWVRQFGREARARYDSGAALSTGQVRRTLEVASALMSRLLLRDEAAARGGPPPARYYELRDEWMARIVTWLADSAAAPRKVVVWLHNDHARYGAWSAGALPVRAAGSYLREWKAGDVFSLGLFMGRGVAADNSRRPRPVAAVPENGIERQLAAGGYPASYLVWSGRGTGVREWAMRSHPYLRAGMSVDSLIPGREFDGLIYIDSVSAPSYRLR